MSSGEEREGSHVGSGIPEGRVLPLNSRRLVAEYVKAIATSLGLSTRASTDEGKLSESEHEPRNVQVVIQEPEAGTESTNLVHLFLVDEAGVFKEIETERGHVRREARTDSGTAAAHAQQDAEASREQTSERDEQEEYEEEELDEVRSELQQKTAQLESVTQQLSEAVTEIEHMKRELPQEKERYKQLWRMSCANLVEHDAALAAKDDEITSLRRQLSRSRGVSHATLASTGGDATGMVDPVPRPGTHLTPGSPTSSHTTSGHEPAGLEDVGRHHRADRRLVTTVPRRQGKAPPVDPFTGEDPEMRFEDWLPSLDRAAEWNQWTPQESLLQLAGHLRGRAHQEWGLLEENERSDWKRATTALRARLDPGNKVIAAQDFRHTTQEESEKVADFIRRLERTFRIAYGSDHFNQETREALLYGQLHEGLRPDLMQNSTVSGALTYQELCMAARNEEQRKAEMKKRRQYRNMEHGPDGRGQRSSHNQSRNHSGTHSYTKNSSKSQDSGDRKQSSPVSTGNEGVRLCYQCGKPGHLARDCRARKSESRGGDSSTKKQTVPEALLSDRGTNLLSHLMRDVCRLLGIEKYNTTAYHPQCNGLNERFNLIQSHIKNDAQKACR
jgi:hypothetical protein